jgi:short-subunit dehydrogenase involved in D-alanine esterification of teichoic acids
MPYGGMPHLRKRFDLGQCRLPTRAAAQGNLLICCSQPKVDIEAALANGDQVAATARKVADPADLKQKYGKLVTLLSLDVTDEIQAEMAVETIIKIFGRLDVLVIKCRLRECLPR